MEDSLNQTVVGAEEQEEPVSIEDPFNRLPDELIVSQIFDRICEAKCLFRCSLVSRHFSSLVFRARAVSFQIPCARKATQNHPSLFSPAQVLRFTSPPLRMVNGWFASFLDRLMPSFDKERFTYFTANFLTKFRSLRSLYLELDYSGTVTVRSLKKFDPLVFKWKIDSRSGTFLLLRARRLRLATTDKNDDYEEGYINPVKTKLLRMCFNGYMAKASRRYSKVEMLVRLLPESLENVVLTDTKKEGTIDLRGTDLARIRNGIKGSGTKFGDGEANIRVWYVPFLKLPISGGAMKNVTLFISKDAKIDYDDRLIAQETFDGEALQQVYAEAVMEMLKKDVVSQQTMEVQDFSFVLSED